MTMKCPVCGKGWLDHKVGRHGGLSHVCSECGYCEVGVMQHGCEPCQVYLGQHPEEVEAEA